MSKYKRGTFIHGIAASQHLDSSGERIIIEGVDISSLTKDGIFNLEHNSKEASQMIGKILEAKKILKRSDCENDHQKKFWDKLKMPFIYVAGELFDGVGHSAAQDIAAMLRYDKHTDKRKTKRLINLSIEGSRLDRDGANITKCIARKVSITITPCNKVCEAEELEKPHEDMPKTKKSVIDKILGKSESNVIEIYKSEKGPKPPTPPELKGHSGVIPENHPHRKIAVDHINSTREAGHHAEARRIYDKHISGGGSYVKDTSTVKSGKIKKTNLPKSDKYMSNMRKALIASCGVGTPSTKTGIAALSKEDVVKVCKSISDDNWQSFTKREELVEFLSNRLPNCSDKQILSLAKTVAYLHEKKKEAKLEEVLGE